MQWWVWEAREAKSKPFGARNNRRAKKVPYTLSLCHQWSAIMSLMSLCVFVCISSSINGAGWVCCRALQNDENAKQGRESAHHTLLFIGLRFRSRLYTLLVQSPMRIWEKMSGKKCEKRHKCKKVPTTKKVALTPKTSTFFTYELSKRQLFARCLFLANVYTWFVVAEEIFFSLLLRLRTSPSDFKIAFYTSNKSAQHTCDGKENMFVHNRWIVVYFTSIGGRDSYKDSSWERKLWWKYANVCIQDTSKRIKNVIYIHLCGFVYIESV